jgi:dephospho-CoA kinase
MIKKRRKKNLGKIPIIGLVGGVASGKSFVAGILQQLGCARIDADKIGHEMLDNPMIQYSIKQAFGPEIVAADGSVDRVQLGKLVFGNEAMATQRRRRLEAIVHPAIRASAIQQIRRLQEQSVTPIAIVVDAPLLIEAGWEEMCDWIFFIDTPEPIRRERALRRGWSQEHWVDRERAQAGLERKRQAATHFIGGDIDAETMIRQLSRLLDQMKASPGQLEFCQTDTSPQ